MYSNSMFSASCQDVSVLNIVCCNSKLFVYSKDVVLLNSISLKQTDNTHSHVLKVKSQNLSPLSHDYFCILMGQLLNFTVAELNGIPSALSKAILQLLFYSVLTLYHNVEVMYDNETTSKTFSAWECAHC